MSNSQSEAKANVSLVGMPVQQIIVSPITGLLETHTVTINREINQVSYVLGFSCLAELGVLLLAFLKLKIIYL